MIAKIIAPPHLLFTGANGHKTYGVTVEAIKHDPTSGYSPTWNINDITFLKCPEDTKSKLGLSDEEYSRLAAEFVALIG
jgi:hypothetical protein